MSKFNYFVYRVFSIVLSILIVISLFQLYPPIVTTNAATTLPSNGSMYYIKLAGTTNMVVDVTDISYNNGTQLQIWELNPDHQNQIFVFKEYNGFWKITALHSGKVVEVRNQSKSNYEQVAQWDDAGLDSQRWQIISNSDGTISFKNKNSGLYMDVFNGYRTNGSKIIQYQSNGSNAQKYTLLPVTNNEVRSASWSRTFYSNEIKWSYPSNINSYPVVNSRFRHSSERLAFPTPNNEYVSDLSYYNDEAVAALIKLKSIQKSESEQIKELLIQNSMPELFEFMMKLFGKALGAGDLEVVSKLFTVYDTMRGIAQIMADDPDEWNRFVNSTQYTYEKGYTPMIVIHSVKVCLGDFLFKDPGSYTLYNRGQIFDDDKYEYILLPSKDYKSYITNYVNSRNLKGNWSYNFRDEYTETTVSHISTSSYSAPNIIKNYDYKTGNYKIIVLSNSHLNVRSGPGTNYNSIGKLKRNDVVNVLQVSSNWGRINYNGSNGWICLDYGSYLGYSTQTFSPQWDTTASGEYAIQVNNLNIRRFCSTSSEVLFQLNKNDIVSVIKTAQMNDGRIWANILYNGINAYCCMKEGNEYWLTKRIYPSKPSVRVNSGTSFFDTTFTWNNCSNAKSYDIRIYNAAGQVIESKFGLTSTSYNLRLKSGSYQVDVASVYSSDSYTFSDRVSFNVDKVTPEKPTITVSAGNDLSDTFISWNSCKYADCYDMIIYKANGTEYKKITNVKDTSFKGNLSDIADYYVVVTAKNNTDNTQAKSDKKTFKVVSAVPSKPTLNVLPGNNYTSTAFSWNKCDNANTYTLDIVNQDTGETILSKSLTDTSYEMILSISGNYYAKVTSVYTKGGTKTSSEKVNFFVESADVTEFELYVKGVSDSSIYLEWTESLHATQYDVYRYENGEYTLLGKTVEREFTDTGLYVGTEYKYYVKSSNQWTSIESNQATGETILLNLNGSGTEESPYLISSAEDFIEFNSIINNSLTNRMFTKAHFKQTADIDLSNVELSPIGSKEDPFKGTYNGNYCTINGISIDRISSDTGVFGFIDCAVVQNLSVHGTVNATGNNVGGISGTMENGSSIENCAFYGDVIGLENVGGIVGNATEGCSVTRCYQIGNVNGSDAVGGIAGIAKTNKQSIHMSYCYHAGGNVSGSGIVGKHDCTSSQVVYDDCYYLSTSSTSGANSSTNPGVVPVNETVLRNLVDTLGEPFTSGNSINSGYPVFVWESDLYQFKGQGTASSPYLIGDSDELITLSSYVNNKYLNTKYGNAYYLQIADIDLNNNRFTSIGTKDTPFNGKYNGGYYYIHGLNSSGSNSGLFGYAQTIEVKNLIVSGSVYGDDIAGGIIGEVSQYVELTQCSFNGDSNGTIAGGLIGHISTSGKITDSYNIGKVSGNTAGGLVGEYECSEGASEESLMILASYHGNGNVSGKGIIGRISGNESSIKIENTYYLKNAATSDDYALAVNESVLKDLSITLEKPYINSNINNGYPVFDWQVSRYKFKGNGTEDSPYLIETADDMVALQNYINDPSYNSVYGSAYYKQVSDIDLGDREWDAIGINETCPFNGVYEGNYCTVYGLNASGSTYSGLFGQVGATTDGRNAGIYNLIIKYGTSCSATGVTGGTAAVLMNGASIDQCSVIGDLSGDSGVGGVVGVIRKSGNISNSYHNGNVTGKSKVGGIVGYIESGTARIENCYHTSGIVTAGEYSGAIVGQSKGIVKLANCYYLTGTSDGAVNGIQNNEAMPVNATVLQNLSATLGDAFIDNFTVYNDGYPIFAKQFDVDRPTASGDVNADGEISIADAVLLQSWLLGRINDLPDWRAADLCNDEQLDSFDMILMRRLLIELDLSITYGDVNADGEISIADAVMLQSWLLGRINELPDWRAADLCKDEQLDAFDMILMRRLLVESEVI